MGQWVPIPVVGNHSLLMTGKNSSPSTHGKEGGKECIDTGGWEKPKTKPKPKYNKRKRKGTNKRKVLPLKPDISPQKCFVAVQANETMHPAHTWKKSQS